MFPHNWGGIVSKGERGRRLHNMCEGTRVEMEDSGRSVSKSKSMIVLDQLIRSS